MAALRQRITVTAEEGDRRRKPPPAGQASPSTRKPQAPVTEGGWQTPTKIARRRPQPPPPVFVAPGPVQGETLFPKASASETEALGLGTLHPPSGGPVQEVATASSGSSEFLGEAKMSAASLPSAVSVVFTEACRGTVPVPDFEMAENSLEMGISGACRGSVPAPPTLLSAPPPSACSAAQEAETPSAMSAAPPSAQVAAPPPATLAASPTASSEAPHSANLAALAAVKCSSPILFQAARKVKSQKKDSKPKSKKAEANPFVSLGTNRWAGRPTSRSDGNPGAAKRARSADKPVYCPPLTPACGQGNGVFSGSSPQSAMESNSFSGGPSGPLVAGGGNQVEMVAAILQQSIQGYVGPTSLSSEQMLIKPDDSSRVDPLDRSLDSACPTAAEMEGILEGTSPPPPPPQST